MKKSKILFVFIVFGLIFSCASHRRISDLNKTPRRFHNKTVTVAGEVVQTIALPVLNLGVYQLDDGTGKIWVKPKKRIPFKGDRVKATGTIKVGMTISDRNFGVILIESEKE